MSMKKLLTFMIFLFLMNMFFFIAYGTDADIDDDNNPSIKVCLYEGKGTGSINAIQGFVIYDAKNREIGTFSRLIFSGKEMQLIDLQGNLTSVVLQEIRCSPLRSESPLNFNDRPYRDEIIITVEDESVIVINILPLEEYLYGVLPEELHTSAFEASKAQAIVARTYAVARLKKNSGRKYDLKATTAAQVYGGLLVENPDCTRAVDATRGMILTYRGKIARFVCYHSTCGGKTEESQVIFGGDPVPYLLSVQCRLNDNDFPLCQNSRYFQWKVQWTYDEMDAVLQNNPGLSKIIGHLKSIKILARGSSGRVAAIQLDGEKGAIVVKGDDIRRVLKFRDEKGELKPLYSTLFEITSVPIDNKGFFIIEGSGWGHGVGMCQFGAVGMARKGATAEQILQHYFPGTKIEHLSSIKI